MAIPFKGKAGSKGGAGDVAVGETVIVEGCDGQYVVVRVDHARGRVELVKLKAGHIEVNIPIATVHRVCAAGSHAVVRHRAA